MDGERGGAAGELFAAAASTCRPVALPTAQRLSPIERLQVQLPLAGAADGASWDLRPAAVARCGARILGLAAAAIARRPLRRDGVVATLLAGWRPHGRGAHAALSAALVLCADHELNVSAFAARCAASAAATP